MNYKYTEKHINNHADKLRVRHTAVHGEKYKFRANGPESPHHHSRWEIETRCLSETGFMQ